MTKFKLSQFFIATSLIAYGALANAGSIGSVVEDFRHAMVAGKPTTIFGIDNDTLMLNKNDGFYTSGVHLDRQYAITGAAQTTLFAWRAGQELYTNSDIKRAPELIGPPDHPYAAWLYGGVYKEVIADDGTYSRLGLDLGCLGPCAGGDWTQTNLHRILNQPLPKGWSKQVKNELGVVLYGEVAPTRWIFGKSLDITPHLRGRIGNIYTDAGGGITMRTGRLGDLPNKPALYGLMRLDANFIAYNASLQGGYFSSGNVHTVEPKRIVGEAELGIVWRDGKYGVNASIVRRGNEIRDLSNAIGAQNFARLQFTYIP